MSARRLLIALALLTCALTAAAPAHASGLEGVPSFGHVFVLMGENQGLNKLTPAHSHT
jgi:hypothetical protein